MKPYFHRSYDIIPTQKKGRKTVRPNDLFLLLQRQAIGIHNTGFPGQESAIR
ncbi:MAG: hypothetical protein ACJAV3_000009 [Alcanivorax sp.]|jgi:hypothetical protein